MTDHVDEPHGACGRHGDRAERRRRVVAFMRAPLLDKVAVPFAWAAIATASALIALWPFARLAAVLGHSTGTAPIIPLLDESQTRRARFVQRAIARAAVIAPFRADCLPQALAGAALCRLVRVPTTTQLGVALGTGVPMAAHAWVDAGSVRVTGGGGVRRFTTVASFLAMGARR